jgi:hypothetical protein
MEALFASPNNSTIENPKGLKLVKNALQDLNFKKIYARGYKTVSSPSKNTLLIDE